MHFSHVSSKGVHHILVLLSNFCCNSVALQKALKAFKELECAAESGAVIKGLAGAGQAVSNVERRH